MHSIKLTKITIICAAIVIVSGILSYRVPLYLFAGYGERHETCCASEDKPGPSRDTLSPLNVCGMPCRDNRGEANSTADTACLLGACFNSFDAYIVDVAISIKNGTRNIAASIDTNQHGIAWIAEPVDLFIAIRGGPAPRYSPDGFFLFFNRPVYCALNSYLL